MDKSDKQEILEAILAISEDLAEFKMESRGRFDRLDERLVSLEEKVDGIEKSLDEVLEGDVLGRNHITLTRPEYDTIVESVHLPNRFQDAH
ncbi:MAG: hypothetical protein GY906_33300 [bacterium]|nr:hypothetical protein [bacterium]